MANFKIETRVKYYKEVDVVIGNVAAVGNPYIRKDFHEDGSVSTYCGIELDQQQFRNLKSKKWGTKT